VNFVCNESSNIKSGVNMKLEKEDLDVLRLFLSSLFARRQKYLWIDSTDPLNVYFSTMGHKMPIGKKNGKKEAPMVPVYMYKPTVDDFVHKVAFKNEDFVTTLMRIFPFCLTGRSCINISELSTTVNKGLLDSFKYSDDEKKVFITKTVKGKPPVDKLVAIKVSDHLIGAIKNNYAVFHRNVLCNENVSFVPVNNVLATGTRLSRVEIDFSKLPKINSDYLLKIPIYEGLTSISKSEYVKKSKQCGTTNICVAPNKKSVGLVIIYEDDLIKVESVQPVSLWFPKIA